MFDWVADRVLGLLAIWGCLVACGALLLVVVSARRKRGARRCPKCAYDMRAIPGLQCPECGRVAGDESVLVRGRVRRRWVMACAALFVGSASAWVVPEIRSGRWVGWVPTDVLIEIVPRLPDPPPLTQRDASIELWNRCEADALSPRQWRRLVTLVFEDQARRFGTMSPGTFEFRNQHYLRRGDDLGHLQSDQRAKLDEMMRVRFSEPVGGYVGSFVYARLHLRFWREWLKCSIRFIDPDSEGLIEQVTWYNVLSTPLHAKWSDQRVRVARVLAINQRPRVRVTVSLENWDEEYGVFSSKIIQDEIVEITVVPKPLNEMQIVGKQSDRVASAIQPTVGTYLSESNDRKMAWFVLDFKAVAAALNAEGIDTLALRVIVLRKGVVLGQTEVWCDSARPTDNGELIHIPLTIGSPGMFDPVDPDVRLRFVGDPLVAVRNPAAKVCWLGEVELLPKNRRTSEDLRQQYIIDNH